MLNRGETRWKAFPILVFIFLNDLEEFLKSLEGIPLVEIMEKCMSEIIMCVELFILMYADDTVLLADSANKTVSSAMMIHKKT